MEPVDRADQRPHGVAGSAIAAEFRATLALAAPLAAANLAQMAMGVTNTVMVGRLGRHAARRRGARRDALSSPAASCCKASSSRWRRSRRMRSAPATAPPRAGSPAPGWCSPSCWRCPLSLLLTSLDRLLQALGYDAALAAEIGRYLRALAWGAPAFLGFAVLRSLLAALSHARPVMAVLLVCVASNAMLNWLLIFGHLGAPALGVTGSGYASAINQWLMLAGLALCTRFCRVWRVCMCCAPPLP